MYDLPEGLEHVLSVDDNGQVYKRLVTGLALAAPVSVSQAKTKAPIENFSKRMNVLEKKILEFRKRIDILEKALNKK